MIAAFKLNRITISPPLDLTVMKPRPSPEGIKLAATAINAMFLNTPLLERLSANAALGLRLFAKVETLTPIRSFKGRGADWCMANLPLSEQPIVCASAGNFGQGLAYAAARWNRSVIVFASHTANPRKLEAMEQFGAKVILVGQDFDTAKTAARKYAEQNQYVFVEDGDEHAIAEGAGTIAKEIIDELTQQKRSLDAIFVPLGNGALLTGIATWIKYEVPSCKVVGVVAANAPSMKLSWEQGINISTPHALTIADGIAVREPVDFALECMKGLVDEVVAVDEPMIVEAMKFCHRHFGLVVEPAGAVGVAAILVSELCKSQKTVATILCGGNTSDF
jgi:threonine dehydratase